MAVTYIPSIAGVTIVLCLAADSKPSSSANWILFETDTAKKYKSDGASGWTLVEGGGGGAWGSITGTLSDQTDLQSALDAKQATLVSGTNIKTINGSSVLGSGDLVVTGSQPDLIITKYTPALDQTITDGYSAYYSGYYEIADTKYLEIGVGSTLEIG